MKTNFFLFLCLAALSLQAQTISTFESFSLPTDSFWDGTINPGEFSNGNAIFQNVNSGWWSKGFAYSNMKDSTTAGYGNQYSARTAVGYNNSVIYAVGQNGAYVKLSGAAKGKVVDGFYATNTTYAALSMQDGDQFCKKFGGVSGTEPDYLKLVVHGYLLNVEANDSVTFYLADYRASNSADDYIVKDWRWVNLTALGNVDSLVFSMSSTDNALWGMNTPGYFAMDNFTTLNSPVSVSNLAASSLNVFPNPMSNHVNIDLGEKEAKSISIYDASSRLVYSVAVNSSKTNIDVSTLASGVYYLQVVGDDYAATQKLIKN